MKKEKLKNLTETIYRDSSQKSFRYISYNNTNEENDSIQPEIVEDESNDKEGNTQEDGHTSNQVYEMGNLFGNRSFSDFQSRGQVSYSTHDGFVSSSDNDTTACT